MLALYGKSKRTATATCRSYSAVRGSRRHHEEGGAESRKKAAASLEIGRIVPIYESTGQGKLTPRWFRRTIRFALEN